MNVAAPIIIILLAIYFIPSFIAYGRGHHNGGAIFVLNLLLGWSFIGWVVALVWSCTVVHAVEPDQGEQDKPKKGFFEHGTFAGFTDDGHQDGFSLVELLVVVAIIGAIVSVAVMSANQWGPRFRLRSAEDAVVSTLRDGKARAVALRDDVHYNITSNSISWTCAGDNEAKDLEHATIDSWSISNPGYNPRAVLIDGSGSTHNATVSIGLSNEAGNCTVQLLPYGGTIQSACDT